jgi:hypothetical protein
LCEQHRTCIGQRDTAGRSVEQSNADACLEITDSVADGRRGYSTFFTGAAKVAMAGDCIEGGQL